MSQEANETNTSGDGEAVKTTEENGQAVEPVPTVNREDYDSLKAEFSELKERLQQQSALIGKLTNEKKREEKQQATEAPAQSQEKERGDVQEYQELRKQLEDFQNRMKKQEKAQKLGAIELALVEAGAEPTLAKQQADYFLYKLGERIQTSEDDSGVTSVSVRDTDDTQVCVADWAKAFIQSDGGSYLRAGKKGPSVRNDGDTRAPTGKVKLSMAEFAKGMADAAAKGEDAVKVFSSSHSLA